MKRIYKQITLFSLALILSSCIGKNFKNILSELKNETSDNISIVAETFSQMPFIEDEEGNMGSHHIGESQPEFTIFLFAGPSCLTCAEEHQEISGRLKGERPKGYEIYTFMKGLDSIINKDRMMKFKEDWGITWPFAGDPESSMHQTFCEGQYVPCTIIFDKQGVVRFRKTGEVHVEELEKFMKIKIGTDPLPPDDLGDNLFFGRFLEDVKSVGQRNEQGEVEFTEKTFTKNLDRPLLLLLSEEDCVECERQHKELVDIYHSANTTLKEIDVLTAVTSANSTAPINNQKLKDDWIEKLDTPWQVTAVNDDITTYFEKFCHPADSNEHNKAPCTSLFIPGKGIVMQRGQVSENLILETVRKHLNPVHFVETIEVVTEIPEKPEDAIFETLDVSSQEDNRPIVLVYGGSFCEGCQKEHQALVEEYKKTDSFLHDVRIISLVRGYSMENEFSRNSFIQTWKIGYGVPWEMAIITDEEFDIGLDIYCKDPTKKYQGAPCTSIFKSKYGKIYEKGSMHLEDIEKAVKGEEIEPHPIDGHRN